MDGSAIATDVRVLQQENFVHPGRVNNSLHTLQLLCPTRATTDKLCASAFIHVMPGWLWCNSSVIHALSLSE